jgi:2-polyprenyl-3-methyl-5-hydroxy-6-metoxy-1,4-benzoquinol methylase
MNSANLHETVIGLYERHAEEFDRDRGKGSFFERRWLDRFTAGLSPGAAVLDVGCGTGEPIARYLYEGGFELTGIDSSQSMIRPCRRRLPDAEWHVLDMRQMVLDRRFDGIIAWDSFFHLSSQDQRPMFARFAAHARPGAMLMFTSGTTGGETIGSYCGEPLYHASLDAEEYRRLLGENGFPVLAHREDDPECGNHTIWLARHV